MRILVFSDSHGSTGCMRAALQDHPEADMIIHLGDGEHDLEKLSEYTEGKKIVQVCGNCDLYSFLPVNEIVNAGGAKIFCTHGFKELVKHGTEQLVEKARSLNATIALYGHTHQTVTWYEDGLHVMNPGSIRSGEYGVIDITPSGIMLLQMDV